MRYSKRAAFLALAAAVAVPSAANASVTININQSGADVVANGSGTINTEGLTDVGLFGLTEALRGSFAYIGLGADGSLEGFTGLTGPTNFGAGALFEFSDSHSGTLFAINGSGFPEARIFLPVGYGGETITDTATWLNSTIAGLGLTPGSYVFNLPHDTVTVNIVDGPVPEPATWMMMLLGFGAIGFVMRRKATGNVLQTA